MACQWGFDTAAELLKDLIDEKEDFLIRLTEEGFSDVKSEMKTGFKEVKEEVHPMRDDLESSSWRKWRIFGGGIAEIKASVARVEG